MNDIKYITDDTGKKISVVLSIQQYEKLIEDLEDLDDIRLYDEAKKDTEGTVPFDEYLKQRKAKKHG